MSFSQQSFEWNLNVHVTSTKRGSGSRGSVQPLSLEALASLKVVLLDYIENHNHHCFVLSFKGRRFLSPEQALDIMSAFQRSDTVKVLTAKAIAVGNNVIILSCPTSRFRKSNTEPPRLSRDERMMARERARVAMENHPSNPKYKNEEPTNKKTKKESPPSPAAKPTKILPSHWKRKPLEGVFYHTAAPRALNEYTVNPANVPLPPPTPTPSESSSTNHSEEECDGCVDCLRSNDDAGAGDFAQIWLGAFQGEIDMLTLDAFSL